MSDQDVMEALISNVYAAYEYCDEQYPAEVLHDLWNELIFAGDSWLGREDALVSLLKNISEMLGMEE